MRLVEDFPVLVVVVPLVTAVLIPLLRLLRRDLGYWAALAASAASFVLSLFLLRGVLAHGRISYWLGGWQPPWGIEYVVDYLNGFVLVVVSFIAVLVAFYCKKSIEAEIPSGRLGVFYSAFMLLVAGLLGIVITGDIFNLYVFIEISSLASYTLIASGRRNEALTASYNYLILGTIGATFILLGVGHLYMVTGTLNMADLSHRLPELYGSTVVLTAFAFFSVGLSLKLALFPLHVWMPDAYATAPSPVSAILAATSTKVGAYALLRVMFSVFSPRFDAEVVPFMSILVVLGSVAVLAGSVLAIAQRDIKRMLAYSSVGQIGYIVLGAAMANRTAMTGSLLHILNHALMKGALFLVVGVVVYRTGILRIADLRGLGRKMPLTMGAFTVAALSMIGVPLTVGFVSKWYLALGALEAGMWYVVAVILLSSVLTAVYFWRIVESIYFGEPVAEESWAPAGPEGAASASGREAPWSMLLPTLVMAGLCVVFGIATSVPVEVAHRAADMLLSRGL
ncbi:MAG: monovalent cation/H+ antiporter subunit D family protein [Nitrospirota bacterium]